MHRQQHKQRSTILAPPRPNQRPPPAHLHPHPHPHLQRQNASPGPMATWPEDSRAPDDLNASGCRSLSSVLTHGIVGSPISTAPACSNGPSSCAGTLDRGSEGSVRVVNPCPLWTGLKSRQRSVERPALAWTHPTNPASSPAAGLTIICSKSRTAADNSKVLKFWTGSKRLIEK
jgi:hypothetical protein